MLVVYASLFNPGLSSQELVHCVNETTAISCHKVNIWQVASVEGIY
jgi:hypothetical protein